MSVYMSEWMNRLWRFFNRLLSQVYLKEINTVKRVHVLSVGGCKHESVWPNLETFLPWGMDINHRWPYSLSRLPWSTSGLLSCVITNCAPFHSQTLYGLDDKLYNHPNYGREVCFRITTSGYQPRGFPNRSWWTRGLQCFLSALKFLDPDI